MKETSPTKNPHVELANKDWVMRELIDTERRIEKAFHEQTQFMSNKTDSIQNVFHEQAQLLSGKTDSIQNAFHEQAQFMSKKTDNIQKDFQTISNDIRREIIVQTRWMIGVVFALIIAVLFKDSI